MQIKNKVTEDKFVISLCGEIDQHSSQRVKEHLDEIIEKSAKNKILFDFGGISFMDSTGIGIILGRYKKFKPFGKVFFITNANATVDKIMKLSGIYEIMPRI